MKKLLTILILTATTILFFSIGYSLGEIQTNPPTKQSVIIEAVNGEPTVYREVNEWEDNTVKTTVTVPDNICNYCIKNFNPSQCLEACGEKVIYE